MVRKGIQHGLASVVSRDISALHRSTLKAAQPRHAGIRAPVLPYPDEVFGGDADAVTILDKETPSPRVELLFPRRGAAYYGGGTAAARNCPATISCTGK